jgi:7-cyano-7-deazaguanine tRNA-ribosyltransferase
MMRYYVSWTHSDPIYQEWLPAVKLLISPPNVSLAWSPKRWKSLPEAMIIDSGAYQYCRERRSIAPEVALARQLQIAQEVAVPVGICHLDVPLLGTRQVAELERRVTQSLTHARWFMDYIEINPLPAHAYPIGVIQGYSVETVYYAAQLLADMGFTHFALGSLVGMVTNARDELVRRVEAAIEAVGTNLHVLGISSAPVLALLARLGILSVDSGAPMHEASRGGLFYSQPFRRYKLDTPHFREWERNYGFASLLSEPLLCDCPTCRENPAAIMQPHGKVAVNQRGLHNYYHLRRELEGGA